MKINFKCSKCENDLKYFIQYKNSKEIEFFLYQCNNCDDDINLEETYKLNTLFNFDELYDMK